MEPLNPPLFHALETLFGHVRVSNEGQERLVVYAPAYGPDGPRLRARTIQAGEEYRVNCPFCTDTRGRFYVNHAYGEYDETAGTRNCHLVCCFNENCHAKKENRDRFRRMVELAGLRPAGQSAPLRRPHAADSVQAGSFAMPEGGVPVNQLSPDHPAARYLVGRGFDLDELWRVWGVEYCEYAPSTPPVFQRIVIPIHRPPLLRPADALDDAPPELAGWQARAVGDPEEGTPKYVFCSGLRKSALLYGLPQALTTAGPVVVCEGPTDVWRFGPGAVALFGKTMSPAQKRLVLRSFEGRPVVVALDRDAGPEAEQIREDLLAGRSGTAGDSRVLVLRLPEPAKDPADLTRGVLAGLVADALRRGEAAASREEEQATGERG